MPYKEPATINISHRTKRILDSHRDYLETWEEMLLFLLNFWIDSHKNNKKISQDGDAVNK